MMMNFLGRLFASYTPDLQLKMLAIQKCHSGQTKKSQQKPSFFSQRTREGATQQDRKLLNNKYSPAAKYHTCALTHTHTVCGPIHTQGLPWQLSGKHSACQAGDPGSIPGSERSPGEGNGYPLQYSCLENPMDRGAWQATVCMQI